MSRTQALAAAVLALAVTPAAVRAEPLDLFLQNLGAPSAAVWTTIDARYGTGTLSAEDAAALANEAKTRFVTLSVETALAFSSALLQPAATTGVAGWDVGFETSYAQVHSDAIGVTELGTDPASPQYFGPRSPWQTRGAPPTSLLLAGFHVRKALPFSVELGGRAIYLSQSNYYGGQVEAKIAVVEGYKKWPDVAVRGAYTAVLGQKDWNLATTELGLLVSKRLGLNGVSGMTPYLAVRWSRVDASTEVMDFAPDTAPATPADLMASQAAFPDLSASLLRYTLGTRFNASTLSLGVELTYLPARSITGKQDPAADQYPTVKLASSWSGSFRLGWDF